MSYKLLIVDDELPNLRLLERMFRRDYYCLTASSGPDAMRLIEQHDVAIVITDQRMPEMTGIELLRATAEMRPHMVRILLTRYADIEALVDGINCGLVDMYLTKPWNNDELKLKVSLALEQYESKKKATSLVVANERLSQRLQEMKAGFVRAMRDALKGKDEHVYQHGSRVSRLVASLGQNMGLSEESCSELFVAGSLHDIGIIATAAGMPLNVGGPTAEYLVAMQENCQRGAQILSTVPELRDVADILRFHHENFDGSGSPRGLVGEQIPLTCRILRVVDEYDLMTNPRPAATPLSAEEAITNLESRCGKEFDSAVVRAFVELIRQPEIKQEALTEDFLASDLPEYAMN